MAKDCITKTKKGVFGGNCPECNLMLMENEVKCERCGATWKSPCKAKTLDGKLKKD